MELILILVTTCLNLFLTVWTYYRFNPVNLLDDFEKLRNYVLLCGRYRNALKFLGYNVEEFEELILEYPVSKALLILKGLDKQ